jgi:hypothetical protein
MSPSKLWANNEEKTIGTMKLGSQKTAHFNFFIFKKPGLNSNVSRNTKHYWKEVSEKGQITMILEKICKKHWISPASELYYW